MKIKNNTFRLASEYRYSHKGMVVKATGEFRNPKKGEWYISGAIPEGYKANCDMSTKYYIAKLHDK